MGSWFFDGVDDRLSLPDSPALRSLTDDYTLWGWAKPLTGGQNFGGVMAKVYSAVDPKYSSWCVQQAGTSAGQLRNHGVVNGLNWGMNNNFAFADQWVFFVATRSGKTSHFRVWDAEGTLVDDIPAELVPEGQVSYTAEPLYIGTSQGLAYWRGYLACLGAHNAIVSESDLNNIRRTHQPAFTPSAMFLPLNTSTATDTAQGATVTVTGATYSSTESAPMYVSAPNPDFYFYRDGTLIGSTVHRLTDGGGGGTPGTATLPVTLPFELE